MNKLFYPYKRTTISVRYSKTQLFEFLKPVYFESIEAKKNIRSHELLFSTNLGNAIINFISVSEKMGKLPSIIYFKTGR